MEQKQWEHKVIKAVTPLDESQLHVQALEGWELTGCVPHGFSQPLLYFYFKREKR